MSNQQRPFPVYLKKTIALVGMMGSGKTSIGKSLARSFGFTFLDSDAEIVSSADCSITDFFARYGEPCFRETETKVLKEILHKKPVILATGGGAFMREENRNLLSAHSVSVYIDVDFELLWQRVQKSQDRPLLQTENPKKRLREIYETRRFFYESADFKLPVLQGTRVQKTSDNLANLLYKNSLLNGIPHG